MIKLHDVDQVKQQIKDGGASLASLDSGFLFMVTFSSQFEKKASRDLICIQGYHQASLAIHDIGPEEH